MISKINMKVLWGKNGMEKIKEYLERNSKQITEIIESEDVYRIEDISELTKLNCQIAETYIKIVGDKDATISSPKKGTRTAKKQK